MLGLGDVYLGAPCAVPVNPMHRVVTTKMNPARTFTHEGTVGKRPTAQSAKVHTAPFTQHRAPVLCAQLTTHC